MKTRAAVLIQQNQPLEIFELTIPSLKEGQVLVKLAYSGICHSQLNEIKGYKGPDPFLPHTLGHEGSGMVLEVGPKASKVKKGQHVVLSWIKGKGLEGGGCCYAAEVAKVNSGPISTFLTHAVVSENRVVPVPNEMPLKEAALLGCALPTGAGAVRNEMGILEGQSFAIFGLGGVGLSALLAAKLAKAHPRIAVDVRKEKLQKAKEFGATHTFNALICDPVTAILEATQGKGADFVFESAGKKEAMEKAFSALSITGHCVLAGNLPKGEQIAIDPFELIRGKKISGTWGGKSNIDAEVEYYAQAFLEGSLDLSPLITHVDTLDNVNQLLEALEKGEVGRALIDFTAA